MGYRTKEQREASAQDRPRRDRLEQARVALNRQLCVQANAANPPSRQVRRRRARLALKAVGSRAKARAGTGAVQ